MPTNRLGRNTHQALGQQQRLGRSRHSQPSNPDNHLTASAHYLRRIDLRRLTLEVHTPATRSARATGRNGTGVLHCDEPIPDRGHHRRGDVQRDARASGAVFQQDTVFLFRGAEAQQWRDGRYAGFLLH